MNQYQARRLIQDTFTQAFDKDRFANFTRNLLNHIDESESRTFLRTTQYIKDAFKPHVQRFERLGTYTSPDNDRLDVLVVHLTNESKLERARTAIRNFVADHLKTRDEKDAAIVAFVSPTEKQWRFSYVKMEYATITKDSGKVGVETRLTPARRFSYIVGEGESCHTAQTRFLDLLQDTETDPALADIEEAFSVEAVTREFFTKYRDLFEDIHKALDRLVSKDKAIHDEFERKSVNTVDFAKKLMGQIVFLYFLQKKGWLGVEKGKDWGTGPHDFLRRLADTKYGEYDNFFNDVLEPLFYDTLATDRGHEAWCNRFKCRIPFLNGGLFEPLGDYDWRKTDIILPNKLFLNSEFFEEGITGTGVLDVFDRYNFTVNEAEPLEKEVAIDPEMLGKVFENLIEENLRKGLGSYYTPREIVHYMCQESLINYLDTNVNKDTKNVPREDIETFVRLGEQISHYEAVDTDYKIKMPKSIEKHARLIDDKLAKITVCDPAVGSGAFPVGMMHEIVHARIALTPYFNDVHERTAYHFKRRAIQHCLYGVDIDPGAVEIAKLRLWLSLVVDEEDVKTVKPLPNLDYKVVAGNSLLGVGRTLLNDALFQQLERFKPQYFDETEATKKAALKCQIDDLICRGTDNKKTFDLKIYFSEVFHASGGFDVVIGNPPYLESRNPAFEDDLKTQLQKAVAARWPGMDVPEFIPRGSDLLIYFIETGIYLINKTGVVALITQNAWLDTEYGRKFQRFLLTRTHVTLIVDSDFKHFDSTDGPNVNTVISFCCGKTPVPNGYITFVRFQEAFSVGIVSSSGVKIDLRTPGVTYRQFPYSSKVLRSTKWGGLLSLDDTVLDLISLLEQKAQPLANVASCTLSFGQGLNLTKDFFVSSEECRKLPFLSKALIPILSTADGALFDVQKTQLHLVDRAVLTKDELARLREAGIRPFERDSTSKPVPLLIMPRGIGRHYCAHNSVGAFSSSCVDIYAKPARPDDEIVFSLWAILNSSLAWLLREVTGRKNLGGGMLKAEAVDMKELPLFMHLNCSNKIKALMLKMRTREALDSAHEIDTEDHKRLDQLVFDHMSLPYEMRTRIVEGLRQKMLKRANKAQT